ncbi:MAG: hypothetical protein IH607_06485, partial [Firmicutes bacterium]|nr:hypothetical protein [Bacillota bacterium]
MNYKRLSVSLLAALLLCLCLAAATGDDVESLILKGSDVQSLNGLSAYPALQTLTLIDCPALDLTPLAGCKKLTSLTIRWSEVSAGNGSYDLAPLTQCARLHTLTLAGPGITDLSSLPGIPRLSHLTVESVAAADYSPLESLSLKHLGLYGVDAASAATVFTAVGRGLTSAAAGGCTLTPEANDAILSCTRLISLGFTDAEGIDGQSARWAKLKTLTSLTITGGSVSSLAFADPYVSTVGVKLTDVSVGGSICSIDFDKYFLFTSDVPEVSLLQLLRGDDRHWQYASVRSRNAMYSADVVAALGKVSGLLSLDMQAFASDAFSPDVWDGFAKLEQLKISDCPAVPLHMLQRKPNIERLSVRNAAIEGAARIASLQRLDQLSLIRCTVDDWAFVQSLPAKLSTLTLASCNGTETLALIKDLENLKALVLENAPVTDIAPLTGMKLDTVSLYGCAIADYTPLQTLPSLKRLY